MIRLPAIVSTAIPPSPREGRQLLQDELAKADYHAEPPLDRALRWIGDLVDRILNGPGPAGSGWSPVVTALVGVVVIATLAWVLPKVRRERRARGGPGGVIVDPTVTAGQYRALAVAAMKGGRFGEAVLQSFRAIARDMGDRTVLDDAPGRTAHEVSLLLAPCFPDHSGPLAEAANLFDAIRYGGHPGTGEEAMRVAALDADLARCRPALDPRLDPLLGAESAVAGPR